MTRSPTLTVPGVIQMVESEQENREAMANRDPFIDGYFTQRIRSGEQPCYGYPTNHLPETTIARMGIDTSFIAARKSKK